MSSEVDSEGRFWRIREWFPDMSAELETKLRAYFSELIFFNGRMNLISPRSEKNADLVHIADGILGSKIVLSKTTKKEIYDLGSGNGIPGLVLALLAPERKVVLVDADARKAEFLKHCASRMGLANCAVRHARLEEIAPGSINCAVSRGFASISKALLMARKAAALECEFFHFKGPAWSSEVAEIPSQILGFWEPEHVADYKLPTGESTHSIVLTRRRD